LANLIDLYSSGGNHAKAKELTEPLLAKWPSNPTGLLAAFQAAARRGDAAGKVIALERLLQIEPDNVALRGDLERARSELLNPSQPERG
jgi:hypothetical protein